MYISDNSIIIRSHCHNHNRLHMRFHRCSLCDSTNDDLHISIVSRMKSKKYRYGRYFLLRKFEILVQNNIFICYIFFNILELKDI